MFNYVRAFLSNLTVQLQVDAYASLTNRISRGVPQGSTLSPMLFNIAIIRLPTELQAIPTLHDNIYAYDVTIWCSHGSPAEVEQTPQKGLDIVPKYSA